MYFQNPPHPSSTAHTARLPTIRPSEQMHSSGRSGGRYVDRKSDRRQARGEAAKTEETKKEHLKRGNKDELLRLQKQYVHLLLEVFFVKVNIFILLFLIYIVR